MEMIAYLLPQPTVLKAMTRAAKATSLVIDVEAKDTMSMNAQIRETTIRKIAQGAGCLLLETNPEEKLTTHLQLQQRLTMNTSN
jgi:hypothetical protein